jgi:hypothetical protein
MRADRYSPHQKRVGDGVPRILLTGGDDEGCTGDAGIEQIAEAMAFS